MPETRLAKTRTTLPEGYQFGQNAVSYKERLRRKVAEVLASAAKKQVERDKRGEA
jgi:membrane-bound lytic murein transglycosylase MltF